MYVTGEPVPAEDAASKQAAPRSSTSAATPNRGRDGNKTAFQDHGLWFATNGYVCLVVDTLQLGEIAGIHHGTYNLGRWWWHARGYTPAGVECWNGIRGIDYLVLAARRRRRERSASPASPAAGRRRLDRRGRRPREGRGARVSGMSDLECYVTNKVINGHCDCMFLYNTYQWDWTTIAALFAPRPLLFANSDNDPIFPMDGNRRIIGQAAEVLRDARQAGQRRRIRLEGRPRLPARPARRDLPVLQQAPEGRRGDQVKDAVIQVDPRQGPARLPRRQGPARRTRSTPRPTRRSCRVAKVKLPEAGKFKEWKAGLVKQLARRVFGRCRRKCRGPT